MSNIHALEDRVLILRDRVDVLWKTFNPNQPRDKEGQWSESGGGASKEGQVLDHSPIGGGWLSTKRISAAVNHVMDNAGPLTKEALSHAVAIAVSAAIQTKSEEHYNAVQESVLHLANKMEISAHQAREQVVSTFQKLKANMNKPVEKAKKDAPMSKKEAIRIIDKAIEILDNLELSDEKPKKEKK